ncbi:MAG: hypothetical protein EOP88_17110 [Verrucomicrobiaceae bacterium]|nr:MAG: hypothetical protein EOP88_17110 [Verrucomicrobiaceae bacterium]
MIPFLLTTAVSQTPPPVFTIADLMQILGWVSAFVVAVIGAVMVPTLKAKWQAQAKQEVVVGPQPFEVRMAEEFVTRREFEKLEGTMNTHVVEMKGMVNSSTSEMKGLFQQTMAAMTDQTKATNNLIERRHKTTMEEINGVASKAYEARGRIHENLNRTREELKALAATSDVAGQIGKLADAMSNPTTKVQPTHSNS